MRVYQWGHGEWHLIQDAIPRRTAMVFIYEKHSDGDRVVTNETGMVRAVSPGRGIDDMIGTFIKDWDDNRDVPMVS